MGIFRELSCFGSLRIWYGGLRVGNGDCFEGLGEFSGNFQGIFRELSGNCQGMGLF